MGSRLDSKVFHVGVGLSGLYHAVLTIACQSSCFNLWTSACSGRVIGAGSFGIVRECMEATSGECVHLSGMARSTQMVDMIELSS